MGHRLSRLNVITTLSEVATVFHRIVANWVYGGVMAGVLLLLLAPLLTAS